MKAQEKLTALRAWMAERKIDVVMVPRGDVFQGEEVPLSDDRLNYISGFTGSAGIALISANHAALFSDGRYTIQMQQQIGEGWTSHTQPEESIEGWLKENCPVGTLGIDGTLITLSGWRGLQSKLPQTISLKALHDNPIDAIWSDRPSAPTEPAWTYPDVYAGQTRTDKIKAVLAEMGDADQLLISSPEALCWLLNIRGNELEFTPFYRAFAILGRDGSVTIFTDQTRLHAIDHTDLKIAPEGDLISYLAELREVKIAIDPANCPYALASLVEGKSVEMTNPIIGLKARKNETEINGFRTAHCRDAVAMVRFLSWLEHTAGNGLRETEAGDKLQQFREKVTDFISPSFATICGSGPNGAIVHYRAVEGEDAPLAQDTLCLIDSGGQYLDATTDITRTVVIGTPSDSMRHDFTQVLKAHIALDQAVFPKGTTGVQLDAITRAPLWAAGMDFAHGTGHGVGCCLGVHEGPANISKRGTVPIEAGMVLSNEPGFYITGGYGIRIENLIIAMPHPDHNDHLYFEHVTLVPMDRRLINVELLTSSERAWVNAYHLEVREKIGTDIAALNDEEVSAWFDQATQPL